MKVVADVKVGITPTAGCVCSDGSAKTRGIFDPIWSCKCQCTPGAITTNNANSYKADRA